MPKEATPSAGQAAAEPVQDSTTSQGPADVRQVTVEGENASDGQVVAVPLQVSARSQVPADARQVVLVEAGPQVPSTAAPAATLHA